MGKFWEENSIQLLTRASPAASSVPIMGRLSARAFQKQLESNPQRKWLIQRIHDIKTANIENVVIPNIHEICERFKVYREHLIPRHQRDFPRLIALIKAHALLNCRRRESSNENKTIIGTEVDIQAGFKLYEKVVAPNELGISPEILEIWKKARARLPIRLNFKKI